MIIDADAMVKGIEMLNQYLTEGPVTVNFTKKDGTDRVMRCTRNFSLIPLDKQPKPKLPTDVIEIRDPQLFVVWDLEKQDWRAFQYTTVKTMALDNAPEV
jgi:hypothetical protein